MRIDRLATEFGVSEMTIRRDLDEPEALGVARRIRGGAVAMGPEPFAERHRHNARAKARIAGKLLDLVPNRGTIAFDASSTVYRLPPRSTAPRTWWSSATAWTPSRPWSGSRAWSPP